MKQIKNRICYDMCDDCGSSETVYYKHKDGGIYEVLGYCNTYVDGVTLNLIAYRPKSGITRYVRTVEHFHNSFKEIKPEYEYQWLLKSKEHGDYRSTLAFYGKYETEEYAQERLKKEDFESMIDWQEYDLVKIRETKRLRDV